MSWQPFTWTEIQFKAPRVPERWLPAATWTGTQALAALSFTAAFLTPFAATEGALGLWRLGADLGWTGAFFVDTGLLSHWQVWFALSAFTQAVSVYLKRLPAGVQTAEQAPREVIDIEAKWPPEAALMCTEPLQRQAAPVEQQR